MSIKAIVSAVQKLDVAIKQTLVSASKDVAKQVWNTFGDECSMEDALGVANAIAQESSWKGTSSEGARTSEWKAFVFAVQYRIDDAVSYYSRTYPNFNRNVMFTLARELPRNADGFKAACDAVYKRITEKKASKGAGKAQSISSAITGLFRITTRKKNEVAFRRDLVKLCAKHGIKYGV